jgi:hypothetical protein
VYPPLPPEADTETEPLLLPQYALANDGVADSALNGCVIEIDAVEEHV